MKRVLILGGIRDATQLAAQIATLPGIEVITSLAGRIRQLTTVSGRARIGGFGGVAGLKDYVREQHIDLLLDATYPFAIHMSCHAATVAQDYGLPHLMLVRPPWAPVEGDRWIAVDSIAAAAAVLPDIAQRVFLTIGRQELAAFAHLTDLWFLMRMIDPPSPDTPVSPGTLILGRGPFALAEEGVLLHTYGIGAIVSKNSGGEATYAKMIAARELGVPVVMVQRPPLPAGDQVADVEQAYLWVEQRLKHE
jgi:precorrin-6A/cobalt-precorrin-6A reductase